MKVAHICSSYGLNGTGGAAVAATRLHLALLDEGVESHYICERQYESGDNVHVLPPNGSVAGVVLGVCAKALRGVWRFSRYGKPVHLHLVPSVGLFKLLSAINPDIVHVHWINFDFMSFAQLAKLRWRTVMTMHDLYMVNAIEPHPESDVRYVEGFDRRNSRWLERWLFERKRSAISRLRPTFVAPSEWACKCVKKAMVSKGCNVFCVPNLIGEEFYGPVAHHGRNPRFRLLFGAADARKNPYKGFADLETALGMIPVEIKRRMELLVFGEHAVGESETAGVKTISLGRIRNRAELLKVYDESDVFVFPSRYETQGMVKVEAMMRGLPVVSFDRSACAEGIEPGVSGIVVKDGDIAGFADGIVQMFRMFADGGLERRREAVALDARAKFGRKATIAKMMEIYGGNCKTHFAICPFSR